MFTGIVEELGTVKKIKKGANSAVFTIRAEKILDDLKTGDSVAVNGICLTVTACLEDGFTADVMHETLNRSALIQLSLGQHVNLERAMPANGRFGGHIVAGHVDGTGKITEIRRDDNAVWYTIQASPQIMKYIVTKGSVTVDGISLTVAKVSETDFSISAIPHTVKITVLGERKEGDMVNLETDIIGKYVEKLITPVKEQPVKSNITRDFLSKYSGVAREVLEALLDKYMNTGIYEIEKTEVLQLDPFKRLGKPSKIAGFFGGKEGYLKAIRELEIELYKAG